MRPRYNYDTTIMGEMQNLSWEILLDDVQSPMALPRVDPAVPIAFDNVVPVQSLKPVLIRVDDPVEPTSGQNWRC